MIDSKRAPYPRNGEKGRDTFSPMGGNEQKRNAPRTAYPATSDIPTIEHPYDPARSSTRTVVRKQHQGRHRGVRRAAPRAPLSRMKRIRCGFVLWRSANPSRSSHHSADGREKWATSASVTAELEGGDGDGWFLRG
jgi:hypothetical protein